MSVLAHGAIVTAVVVLGMRPRPVDARMPDAPKDTIIYIPVEPRPEAARRHPTHSLTEHTEAPIPTPPFPTLDHIPTGIPPVDVSVAPISDQKEFTRGVSTGDGGTDRHGLGGPAGGVLEERYVDRSPRILGNPISPEFPTMLRERGVKIPGVTT